MAERKITQNSAKIYLHLNCYCTIEFGQNIGQMLSKKWILVGNEAKFLPHLNNL